MPTASREQVRLRQFRKRVNGLPQLGRTIAQIRAEGNQRKSHNATPQRAAMECDTTRTGLMASSYHEPRCSLAEQKTGEDIRVRGYGMCTTADCRSGLSSPPNVLLAPNRPKSN